MRSQIIVLIAVAALAGCDRSEREPVKSASQQAAPSQAARTDTGALPSQQPVQADVTTGRETPVQGQADARESDQKQHFDNKR